MNDKKEAKTKAMSKHRKLLLLYYEETGVVELPLGIGVRLFLFARWLDRQEKKSLSTPLA